MICCFSDLSRTHLKGSRGIKIKIKGKRGKHLHENTIIWEEIFYFFKIIFSFPFHEHKGRSEKQQINWVWPNVMTTGINIGPDDNMADQSYHNMPMTYVIYQLNTQLYIVMPTLSPYIVTRVSISWLYSCNKSSYQICLEPMPCGLIELYWAKCKQSNSHTSLTTLCSRFLLR